MSTSLSYKIEVIAKDGEVIYSQTVHEETEIGHVLEVDANQEYMYTNGVCEIPQANGQVYRITNLSHDDQPHVWTADEDMKLSLYIAAYLGHLGTFSVPAVTGVVMIIKMLYQTNYAVAELFNDDQWLNEVISLNANQSF